jgi:N-acetylglucosamine kinase-like BadF-type ATPase
MLLIADSGSTKTDWRLVNDEGKTVTSAKTEGLNPYFLTREKITSIVREKVVPFVDDVQKVFFYGAGCGVAAKANQVKEALESAVPARSVPEVSGDILGTARCLLQREPGIACILGTGSNSCVYDGNEIVNNIPSLGFMFSDWGSGTVMSKDLIALILQQRLPAEIIEDFEDAYSIGRAQILDSIYNKPLPNRFLASFTPFLLKYAEVPECKHIILDNFRNFFHYYVLRYPLSETEIKLSFTGSVAFSFKKYLVDVAGEMGITIEKIVQHPMDGLVKYHCVRVPIL